MKKIDILYLEDSVYDAELVSNVLHKGGIDFSLTVVDGKEEYTNALKEGRFDLVLSDHSLFQFNSSEALKICMEYNLNIPFILITGTVSEEFAVKILKEGADDYLLKDNLARLPNAVIHAIKEKQFKKEKEEINRNLKLLFENIDEVFFSIDVINNKFLQISDACLNVYGITKEKFLEDTALWLKVVHPEDKLTLEKHTAQFIDGKTSLYEYRIIRPDKSICWIQSKIVPTLDNDKRIIRIDGITTDISLRKIAEQKLESKCEELKTLMYRLSHDLKGPLASTSGLINLSKKEVKDNVTKKYLDMIEVSNNRLHNILQGIIQLVSIDNATLEFTKIDFNIILQNIIGAYKNNEDINIEFKTDIKLRDDFYCNEQSIHSVLYNLISNAVSYGNPNSPCIKISIQQVDSDVIIQIKDNGIGIPIEFQQQIFEMFFRANQESKGSGLGLYIVKNIIQKLNGIIKLESEPRKGTLFTITLPIKNLPSS